MEEVNRQIKMEEDELERVLIDKKRNEELARIERIKLWKCRKRH